MPRCGTRAQSLGRRWLRAAGWGVAVLLVAVGAAALAGWIYLRGSLPQLDGQVAASGLAAQASIERDAQGSVTVTASNRIDLAYATGYAHGQDRFFQMDLLRRIAAGELAGLIGKDALPLDMRNRLNRFRARADMAYAALRADQQMLLRRYAQGVNDAMQAPRARPFEYAVLRTRPEPWRPQDALLIIDAMYLDLQSSELARVLSRGALRDRLPPDLLAFLTPTSSTMDAPLDNVAMQVPALTVPSTRPAWLDGPAPLWSGSGAAPDSAVGSNGFAVAASHGADGRAMVANDMHLGLGLPNIWYRLTLVMTGSAATGPRRISGVSLPGAPLVVAGSNGDVAWGYTNSYGHYIDLVDVQRDPADPRRYKGASGAWETAAEHVETIAVKDGAPVNLPVLDTRWGPMLEIGSRTYAIRWTAQQPWAADLGLQALEDARDVPDALRIAQTAGVPTQNFMVADRGGRIGWTLAGPLFVQALDPAGFPVPSDRADASSARLPAQAYPMVIDPPLGRLWTANSTQLGDPARQRLIGDGGADAGARSRQIRDALLARDRFNERDLLAIQLDDRALWLNPWHALMRETLDARAVAGNPDRAELARILGQWSGRADVDSAAYSLVRDFHDTLYQAWFGGLDTRLAAGSDVRVAAGTPGQAGAQAHAAWPALSVGRASSRLEPVMRALAEQHAWIPSRYADWRAFMLAAIDATIQRNRAGGARLQDAYWGDRNRLAVGHPFARLLPEAVRGWLSAPALRMPGDINMPRVQRPSFGASERFVVSPGQETQGIMEMPGGASGHPLSPYFLAGHEDWVQGAAAPFLPGPAAHRLALSPDL